MSNLFTSEMQELIRQTLPAHVGSVLADELKELADFRLKVPALRTSLDNSERARRELNATLEKLNANKITDDALTLKQADIAKRELNMAMTEMQLKIANERREEIKGLVVQLFRSPMRVETISGNMPLAVPGTPGGGSFAGSPGSVQMGMLNKTTTTSDS